VHGDYLLGVINETRERFLRSILEHIPLERIVEVHLFPAIRQGQVETGVAVMAVTPVPGADVPAPEFELPASGAPAVRTEVHTASYRWTRKGPDRGKWEVDVVAQADAPLATVETVVRGVQFRAGEALDAHRLTAAEIHAALNEFAPVDAEPAAVPQEAVPQALAGSPPA
jgi:hypothetical protein